MMGCLEADLEGLDLFVVQRRVSTYDASRRSLGETRKLTEISLMDRRNVLCPICVFDGKKFSQKGLSALLQRISETGGMNSREARAEFSKRESFIAAKASGKRANFEDSFWKIQGFMFGKDGKKEP